jgi:hypothetical protein
MTDDPRTTPPPGADVQAQQQQQQQQQVQVTIDASSMTSAYTNWYRVTGTPEELIIDFGLNPQMGQVPTEPIKLTNRLVMNFYTAKRLMSHLQWAVSRHESFFGVLEVDFQKRVRGVPPQPQGQQTGIRPAGGLGGLG